MSMNYDSADYGYVNEFSPNYFDRQNDLLNAFKGTTFNAYSEPNTLSSAFAFDQTDLFQNKISGNCFSDNLDSLSHFKEFGTYDKDLESVEATIDNYESSHASSGEVEQQSVNSGVVGHSISYNNEVSAPLDMDAISTSTIKLDLNEETEFVKLQTTSVSKCKSIQPTELCDTHAKPTKTRKRQKLFSRRKDVIIKTLLRKCRKFLTQDFNTATNYAKQKRRLSSSIFADLLGNYLTSVVKVQATDSLVAFLGALLYQQDMDNNMDSFSSPNLTPATIQETSDKIHEILYKYSHQKFKVFTKYSDFVPLFMHFYNHGTDSLRNDPEYDAGLEIINDQLHSSLQEC
jgi:hypothetical protein